MGKFKSLVLVLVLVALVPVAASAQGTGSRPAVVSVGSYVVQVGQEFMVPVRIAGVRDLYAYDVRLPHDRAILQGVRVEHGGWLIPGFVIRQGFYEWGGEGCGGYCAWYAMTQLRPALPVSGSGVLINVVYRAVAPGVVQLQPWVQLSAAGGIPIPATVQGGTVTVVAVGQDR